ncbi:MAG: helix-turn-helix transcriptional regulator [Kiritimatiellae bacterium]|nr:helix-turn-helix transcriptional regulator [Kiritimatiellia bacterium]
MTAFKLARLRAGLTQLAVARSVGVSESKITRIETERYSPNRTLRQRLAILLNTDADELFGRGTIDRNGGYNGHQD